MSPGADRLSAALHVAIVAGDTLEAVRLRQLVTDTGTAISATLCDGLRSATAHLDSAACDVILFVPAAADAVESIRRLRECAPHASLLVLVRDNDETLREQALAAGAQDSLSLAELRPDLFRYVLRHAVSAHRLGRALHTHRSELRVLFDLNPHPMWLFNGTTSKFLAVNRAAIRIYGYSEQEFLSMSVADVRARMPVESPPASAPAATRGTSGVVRHRTRSGAEIEVEISALAVPFWSRNAHLAQARDVTAERRAMRALEASERRFRDLFEHSTGFICIHDLEGTLLSVNPAAAAALGRSVAELLGTPLRDLTAPERRFLIDSYVQRVARAGEDAGLLSLLDSSGRELIWQYRNRVFVDSDGVSYVMGYAQDITAMRAVEQALQISERRLRTVTDTLPLKIAYLDPAQRFIYANEAYRSEHATAGDITGKHASEVLGEERYARRRPYFARALSGERVVFQDEEGEGDDYRCVEITFIPEIAQNSTGVIGVHAMVQDITSKKREEQRLIRLARIDNLTGLLNRAGFYERLDNAIARSRDQDSLLAVFYLDIDRFKQVNDRYGHGVGDALIRAFATRLGDKVRASDVVARLGGDEFTLVMEGVPDSAHIRAIAAKLVAAMRRPFELQGEGVTLSVGASIGIALCRAAPLDATEFVARADAMLYEAKQAGRGTWRLATLGAHSTPNDGSGCA